MILNIFLKFLSFIDDVNLQNKILLDFIKNFIDKCLLFIIKKKKVFKNFKYKSRS